jgi:hypothetical protein
VVEPLRAMDMSSAPVEDLPNQWNCIISN